METDIMKTDEAATYLRLGRPTLEHFRLTGEGPRYLKLGRSVRYRRGDLDRWVETRLIGSTSEALDR